MPTHAEKRRLPHSPEQMFDLVSDVEKYPEFLPWCVATRIRGREEGETGDTITADMVIGYKMFRERFTSKVILDRPGMRIDVAYSEGPFRYLNNHWLFLEDGDGTIVDFYVDFEFRSRLLQKLIGAVFNEAVKIMVHAFEKRALKIYGP
ncbi:MAG: type II toxin-antitoxin system RatA family toxin [Rhodospirillaceae bacterium]|jgi:coenzyme Q-binding protein COQ10|nr:type II toxin-antitoxin system RatA family toxin [Rhodospirillaceae bacterium]MBT3884331.1 type II toxin-antitoxin system RatA family toxin [Rhodospirillaceae bacterium]MBT4118668.1 type II toxin-antitoxin system RatA family toxin [Rhodospirillaceae bacterium]MBT4672540.1 type II toxin-antitoxin system RatA family toxin [Rhodospirillaceae bacterium]MBT4720718.1 type II toxin-antitoxin system RatA family toxin [Rhodospirillaceae bacterium]